VSNERNHLFEAVSRRLTATKPVEAWDGLVAAGVAGIRVAEDHGGLGMGVREAEPVMAALGETGRATPYLESSIVAAGLLGSCSQAGSDVLSKLARSGAVCAVAGLDPRLRSGLTATEAAGQWTISGRATLVLHAQSAAAVIAIVPIGARLGLFLLHSDLGSVSTYPTIDGRMASDFVAERISASLLLDGADEAVDLALDEAQACIAVEAAGIMRRLVRDTVEYTRQRRQFGQTLSDFQVVQHRLVDMHIQAKRASAIATRAMESLDGPSSLRSRLVSAAKATVAIGGRFVGQQAVQLHGAMGMTEELPLSGFFKRLTVIENELGSADDHIARHASFREPAKSTDPVRP
jgi:alkylation response protein AidB-like acyl-CoA dehydrogenase